MVASRIEPSNLSRGLLALTGAAVLLWPLAGGAERLRTRLIAVIAMVSLTLAVSGQLPGFLSSWQVRVWNVYHYYLGAKYFEELGYTALYDATLFADRQGSDYWSDIRRVRNLETYQVEDRAASERRFDPQSFEPDRWRDFRTDVEALGRQRSPRAWRGIFVDRGYNATPLWTVFGATLARLAPAENPLALKLLCSLDLLALAATFWLIWSTFGARAAATVLLLLTLSPVNIGRFIGGFLQYDWFCAVAASACLYRRGRLGSSAALMAYAVMTRVFPLLFVVAGALPMIRTWWTSRRPPKRQLRFLIAFAAWCAAGLLLSLPNGRGVDGWREFVTGIGVHKESHLYGERRIGLQFVFTHELGSPSFDESRSERETTYRKQAPLYFGSAVLLLAAFATVAWHQRSWNARLLGLAPIFALVVTSRYYWSYLSLLPLVGGRRGPPAVRARWLGATQLLLFAGFYALDARYDDHFTAYVWFSALLLIYLIFALAAVAAPRAR